MANYLVTEQVFWLVIGHSVLQVKRLNTFKELKQSIESLWRDLEAVPSTPIGQNLAKDDAEATFKLSSLNIETLKDLKCEVRNITFFSSHKIGTLIMTCISQLENQQKRCVTESTELRETITSLWTKLEMDESERQAFLTKHSGSKPSVIAKVSQYM